MESDRPHPRETLAALLWPESDPEAALSSLRNAIANLRCAIGDREANPSYLYINREMVRFNLKSGARLDVAEVIQQTSRLSQPFAARGLHV